MYQNKLPSHVKKIINYIRKSREEEVQEEKDPSFNALERQRVQMERVLKEYGVPFDQEMEYGSGDKIESRPMFQKILKQIGSGVYQAIAVREIARLGRGSYEDMGQIYSLLEEKRIYIITESRIWDLRNQDDSKFIRMQLFMSREEYFMIKERLQGAREYFAGEGKFMSSRPPFGYISNKKTKVLEIEPEQAKIVRMIFEWYANGDVRDVKGFGYQAISTKLTLMGIKTYTGKKIWQALQIARILKCRTYLGEINYKATERVGNKQVIRPKEEWISVKDAHPAIVSKELFDLVALKLENKKDISPVILEFDPCELAGVVSCTCGKKMVRQYSIQDYKKDNGEVSRYHKEFLYCRSECKVSVKYRDVERLILKGLAEFSEYEDDVLIEYIENIYNQQNENYENEGILSFLEKQKNSQQEKLRFVYEQFEDQTYTKDEFLKRKETLLIDIEKTEQEITKEINKNTVTKKSFNVEKLRNNLVSKLKEYESLNHKTRRNTLLKSVLENVTVGIVEKGAGRKPAKLEISLILKGSFVLNQR